jgi:geranylgeranyl pyrophosphate synthase
MDYQTKLKNQVMQIESALEQWVPALADDRNLMGPNRLHQAMRYSLQAGGKRLRPVLVLTAAELGGKDRTPTAMAAAAAVECIHTYSLIHDDLPCMDNDDLRRGRPTCHRQFDEVTALLAGDALQAQAFIIIAEAYGEQSALCVSLLRELAQAISAQRLVGGQMQDLLAEKQAHRITAPELDYIHLNKTAAMIEVSLVLGGLIGGASPATVETLRASGRHLGLAFQIIDDILDATVSTDVLGKTAGKDAKACKATYATVHGIEFCRQRAAEETQAAQRTIATLPGDVSHLLALTRHMLERGH